MENAVAKAVSIMLSQPEAVLNDKDNLTAICLVKGLHCFSKINQVLVVNRLKTLSDTKLEEIKFELTKGLFYAACLTHLLDYDSSEFAQEFIDGYAEQFYEEYREDAILGSMRAIQGFITISDSIYSNEYLFGEGSIGLELEENGSEDDVGVDTSEGQLDAEIPELRVVNAVEPGSASEDSEEVEENDDEDFILESLADILTVVSILAKRFDFDIESLQRNMQQINKL